MENTKFKNCAGHCEHFCSATKWHAHINSTGKKQILPSSFSIFLSNCLCFPAWDQCMISLLIFLLHCTFHVLIIQTSPFSLVHFVFCFYHSSKKLVFFFKMWCFELLDMCKKSLVLSTSSLEMHAPLHAAFDHVHLGYGCTHLKHFCFYQDRSLGEP